MKTLAFILFALFSFMKSNAQTLKVTSPITGETQMFTVALKDLPHKLDYYEAANGCRKLGPGWRLPKIDELKTINVELYKKGKGNFVADTYWSEDESARPSETTNNEYYYHCFNFKSGSNDWCTESFHYHTRCVKSIY